MNYSDLSIYASFLLEHHLDDFTIKNLKRAREVQLPVLNQLSKYTEKELWNLSRENISDYLRSLKENRALEELAFSLKKWKEGLSIVSISEITPFDIVYIHTMRKEGLISFLDQFTGDVSLYKTIVLQIEDLYSQILQVAFTSFFETQKETLSREKDLTEKVLNSALNAIVALQAIRDENQKIIDFRYILLNRSAELMMQRKREYMIGKTLLSEFPAVSQEGIFREYVRVVEQNESFDMEFKYTYEGLNNWFRQMGSKWEDGIVVITVDITSAREKNINLENSKGQLTQINSLLEIKVREKQEELETIIEINKTIAGELDLRKIVQKVTDATTGLCHAQFGAFFYNLINEKGESYTLYTISGVPKEKFAAFPMPRNTKVFEPTFKGLGVLRSDDITKDPRYGRNAPYNGMPEGHLPVKSYLAVPVISRTGEVLGGLFFGHSQPCIFTETHEKAITGIASLAAIAIDNAKLFEAQKKSEEHFRFMANSIPQIVWTSDTNGELDYFNQQWYSYTGMTFEKTKGWGWRSVIHSDDLEQALESWKSSIMTGELYQIETRYRRASDQMYRWHLTRALPMRDKSGGIIKWFGTATDIHDQKVSGESLIRSNQQLNRINSDLDNFIYTASHDLKAPIANIEGLIDAVQATGSFEQDEELKSLVELMDSSVERFKHTIFDLTEISRVQKSTEEDIEEVDIAAMISEIETLIEDLIKGSGACIHLDLAIVKIRFSRKNFRSIIYNLLTNAVKYRSSDRVPLVEISTERIPGFVLLTFKDNGLGIDEHKKEKMFSMFKRFHNHVEGTGVGLFLVKRIVENAGGKIEVESKIDKGTTFKVFLRAVDHIGS